MLSNALTNIPSSIHQVWYSDESLPRIFESLTESWKKCNPSWTYKLWEKEDIENLIRSKCIERMVQFNDALYDIQRIDIAKYLILYYVGGVYIDVDYECLRSIDSLIQNRSLCLSIEPKEHSVFFNGKQIIGNAFIGASSRNNFVKQLIENAFAQLNSAAVDKDAFDKFTYVLNSTGPYLLSKTYEELKSNQNLNDDCLIPASLLAPLSKGEVFNYIIEGDPRTYENVTSKIKDAYGIHYFLGSWLGDV